MSLMAWFVAQAIAIAPPQPGSLDPALSLEPQRIVRFNAEEQGRLLASPAWRQFVASEGRYQARFDETTRVPRYVWGAGPLLKTDDPSELAASVQAVLERHTTLFGFEAGTLVAKRVNHVAHTDTWYLDFDALRNGLPTFRGGITARVKQGRLVLITVTTAPAAQVTGRLALSSHQAVQRATHFGAAPGARHELQSVEPMLLEQHGENGLTLRTSWMVRTHTTDRPGRFVTFVDATDGSILNVHDEVRYAAGQVTGRHHERTVDGSPLVVSPMPFVYISSNTSTVLTDASGNHNVPGNGPYSTDLDGSYVEVVNNAGGEGFLSENDPDLLWTSASATQAEIDSYVFLNVVKEWGDSVAPEVDWVQGPILSIVNDGGNCNAFWDGNVNFLSSGGGCNNTGQIADVNYHEWGHGFHYFSIESGFFDGSLSEGAGDTVSFLITDDRYIAPYFGTSGWAIRDVAPDKVYPGDFVNNAYYVHDNGLIFGGAMWDLLELLQARDGNAVGTRTTGNIFAGTVKGGTDIPGSFFEAMVADDDDGDLANGTPNICEIYDAFGRHGLGTATGTGAILASHDPIVDPAAGENYPLDVELISVSAGCDTVGARNAQVKWRVNGGSWNTEELDTPGQRVEGEIPEQAAFSFVEYTISGVAADGNAFTSPSGGTVNPYSFFVGDTIKLRCDDFDDDDGGYTHTLVSGEAGDGADDWQWGVPAGQGGDPSGAFSGNKAWGNDLGLEGFNGLYQPNKVNRLRSPAVETGHYEDVFLQYRRWLQVEDGQFDQAVITANGEEVWSNFKGAARDDDHHLDGQWVSHSVDLQGIGDQGDVRVGFEIHSDDGSEYAGWTIDDVCIYAPATPNNRLGITDFTVEATDDTVATLSWTNPKHRPVEQVRVIRRLDRFPEAWDDGDIAEVISEPEANSRVEVEDVNGQSGTTYYAVYAFDGKDWLGWTEEGWNAATVDLVGGEVPLEDRWGVFEGDGGTSPLGCMCNNGGAAPSAWLVLACLTALRRRRGTHPPIGSSRPS